MEKLKKILNVIATVFVTLLILIAVLLVGVRVVGLKPYTVLSGSMEPDYHVGAVVYVKPVDASEIKKNDVITYVLDSGTVVTHRVIELLPDATDENLIYFRTKGDNNNTADNTPVHPKNVLGKVVGTVPLIGYVAYYIQNPPGNYIAICVCILILVMAFLPDLLDKILSGDEDSNELKQETQTESELKN